MRIIFAGTPEPAVTVLRALLDSEHEVVGVITRPDAPKGRGRKLVPSPVGQLAAELNLPVIKPASLTPGSAGEQELRDFLAAYPADCIPVVAYGNLIPEPLLNVVPFGWINLHYSLLPTWRGAAPVQAAIANGDAVSGFSIFQIAAGLDDGPVYAQTPVELSDTVTTAELLEEMSVAGAAQFATVLSDLTAGTAQAVPQDQLAREVSYAPKIQVADCRIDWQQPAAKLSAQTRAFNPAPGCWTEMDGQRVKVGPVFPAPEVELDAAATPGTLHITKKAVFVATGSVPVKLTTVQAPGKQQMAAADWARGVKAEKVVWV